MESTLALKITDLQGEVGLFLGWGRGASNGDPAWTTQQQAAIDSAVKSGLRQFYFPPPDASGVTYDWSFLKPVAALTLSSGTQVLALPDDYGGFEGRITVASTSGQSYWPVELVGIGTVYAQQSRLPTTTGRPLMACQEPLKGTQATQGQRFQLRFWPKADVDYAVQFQYYVLADYLTGATPYALGGMAHVETILESCLAIAEQRLDDASTTHSQKFQERLAASVGLDRRLKPQVLGYNGDRSDGKQIGRREWYGLNPITYRSVTY